MITLIWFAIAVFFLVIELGHPGLLFFLSLSLAAVVTSLIALFHQPISYQIISFFTVTLFIFISLKISLKKMHRDLPKTNVYALLEKTAIVLTSIEPGCSGYVQVDGQSWLARSLDNEYIEKNELVTIIEIRGAHLLVSKKQH